MGMFGIVPAPIYYAAVMPWAFGATVFWEWDRILRSL